MTTPVEKKGKLTIGEEPQQAQATSQLGIELNDAEREQCQQLLKSIERDVNCLSVEARSKKKKALESISKATVERKTPLPLPVQHAVFAELAKPLLKKYEDSVEKVRTLSVELISKFLISRPRPEVYLPYLIPVIVRRLGQKDIKEPSEELRLLMMKQLESVIGIAGKDLSVYIDEFTDILVRTIVDPFPEVKRMGCRCTALIAKAIPERFHMTSKRIVEPLLLTLGHQHSKVRNVCIRAIGATVTYGSADILEEVRIAMAQMTMDTNPTVRRSLYTVAGRWLCDYKDRYSYWHKLLPLLLTGETDEVEEISTLARESFIKAGRLYEKENEDKLKEKIEFGEYSEASPTPYGCVDIVQQNFSKIFPGLMKDLVDWSEMKRRQSSRLLETLLNYEGSHVTMHIRGVIDGLSQGVLDEEDDIAENCCESCRKIGSYVDVEAWSSVILPALKSEGATQRALCSNLIMLGMFVQSAPLDGLASHIQNFAETISHPSVCQSVERETQEEFIVAMNAFLDKFGSAVASQSQLFFNAIVYLLSTTHAKNDAVALLDKLAAAQDLEDKQVLFDRHTKKLLESLSPTADSWTKHRLEQRVFVTLLAHAGPVVGELLEIVIPIIQTNTHPDKDIEVRASFFALLGKLLTTAPETLNARDNAFHKFAAIVINEVIAPSLVWIAGEKASALRTAASSCLWTMFSSNLVAMEHLEQSMDKLLPLLVSLADDDVMQTRFLVMKTLQLLVPIYKPGFKSSYEGYDKLHSLIVPLNKRLNDSSDDIRVQTCRVWVEVFAMMKEAYNTSLYKAHIEASFSDLIIHLDDENETIRQFVFQALESAVGIDDEVLRATVLTKKSMQLHSKELCEKLIKQCS
eukprot:m.59518 g.59518  ORF g.59518 m.59518 type:complete len:861 (+) comp7911_c0_seq5:179-2761(+)